MHVIVEKHTAMAELVCRTESGDVITVVPFVTSAADVNNAAGMVGQSYVMEDCWLHEGVYLCNEFTRLDG
jgi:hypothetical protein